MLKKRALHETTNYCYCSGAEETVDGEMRVTDNSDKFVRFSSPL